MKIRMGKCENRRWWTIWKRWHTWSSHIETKVKHLPFDKLGYLVYQCTECGHKKYYSRGW